MDSINLTISFENDNIENQIKNIIENNTAQYKKMQDSILIIDEILKEENENINILKTEINNIILIHENAEYLYSKIIEISKN